MEAEKNFTKYERARIIGARALQISMDAPLLLNISKEELIKINFDPLLIAEKELESGVLPIAINRPFPEKHEEELDKIKVDESTVSDEEKIKIEEKEEKEIAESGDILELTKSDEEEETEEAPSSELE